MDKPWYRSRAFWGAILAQIPFVYDASKDGVAAVFPAIIQAAGVVIAALGFRGAILRAGSKKEERGVMPRPNRTDRVEWWFRTIDRKLDLLLRQGAKEMATLAEVEAEVRETQTVQESVIVLLNGLKQLLDEAIASADPAKLEELRAALDSSTNALAAAAAANTPGGGTPPPQARRG